MKKTTVTTKVVSILLSIVCAGSALGILGTVSTAAAENKSTAQTSVAVATETVNSDQNTVQPTVQPTEKKTNKRNQPFLNGKTHCRGGKTLAQRKQHMPVLRRVRSVKTLRDYPVVTKKSEGMYMQMFAVQCLYEVNDPL